MQNGLIFSFVLVSSAPSGSYTRRYLLARKRRPCKAACTIQQQTPKPKKKKKNHFLNVLRGSLAPPSVHPERTLNNDDDKSLIGSPTRLRSRTRQEATALSAFLRYYIESADSFPSRTRCRMFKYQRHRQLPLCQPSSSRSTFHLIRRFVHLSPDIIIKHSRHTNVVRHMDFYNQAISLAHAGADRLREFPDTNPATSGRHHNRCFEIIARNPYSQGQGMKGCSRRCIVFPQLY